MNNVAYATDRIDAKLARQAGKAGKRSKAKRVDSESKATLREARLTYSVR